jgi:hypothetical protein
MHRPKLLVSALAVLGSLIFVVGCEPPDDDDSGGDDDDAVQCDVDPSVNSPVVTNVDPCECPGTVDSCEAAGATAGAFQTRWAISVTDVDGDLINPRWRLGLEVYPPYRSGRLEGSLGDSGTLNVDVACSLWTRNTTLAFSARMTDQAGCDSEPFEALWLIPDQEGDDTCAAVCSDL